MTAVRPTWEQVILPEYTIGNGENEVKPEKKFYTASASKNIESIRKNGLLIKYAGSASKDGKKLLTIGQLQTVFNCRGKNNNGHVYFMHTREACATNAKVMGIADARIIEFTLPVGTTFHEDPEAKGGKGEKQVFRTGRNVPANSIIKVTDIKGQPVASTAAA